MHLQCTLNSVKSLVFFTINNSLDTERYHTPVCDVRETGLSELLSVKFLTRAKIDLERKINAQQKTITPQIIDGSCYSEKMVRIVLYDPPSNQSNQEKPSSYQLPDNKHCKCLPVSKADQKSLRPCNCILRSYGQ